MKITLKNALTGMVLLGQTAISFAQASTQAKENEKLLSAVYRDFPELVIKEHTIIPVTYKTNPDGNFRLTTLKGLSEEDTEGYHILIQGEKRTITANYSKDYVLLNAIVERKNVTPKAVVRNALALEYPGWLIAKNSYRMLRNENGNVIEIYKHVLTKGKKSIKVKVDGQGKLLTKAHKGENRIGIEY